MAIFKCKMCGASLNVDGTQKIVKCDYCDSVQTLPNLNDDMIVNLYDRANHFRRNNEFDKAMNVYEQILNLNPKDSEAYWSIILCKFGIEYVLDKDKNCMIPTINRTQFTSILADEDYKKAIEYADDNQKEIYENEAQKISEIQKNILEISDKEDPFDIFISYKETDSSGKRTRDSVLAQDIYYLLKEQGYKVFFSRITLEDKLGNAYEPYIFSALNSSKIMIVLGTKLEYFNAVWVKNEWSRYLSLIKNGEKKTLIPVYKDIDPYDLPDAFSHLQALDMSKIGFMQDLSRGIQKIMDSQIKSKEKKYNSNNVDKKFGEYIMPDGGLYTGELFAGKPNGKGRVVYKDYIYEGQWNIGIKQGEGKIIYTKGGELKGTFENDSIKDGEGKKYYDNGYYEGTFEDGLRKGKGVYQWENGDRYEGDFVDGLRTGKGVYQWENGDRYEGDFVNDYRTGKGIYQWGNGGMFKGEFINDRTGIGEGAVFDGNKIFVGRWKKKRFKNELDFRGKIYKNTNKKIQTVLSQKDDQGNFNIKNFERFYTEEAKKASKRIFAGYSFLTFAALLLVFFIVLMTVIIPNNNKSKQFKQANALFESQQYEQAYVLFRELSKEEGAQEKIMQILEVKPELSIKYGEVNEFVNYGRYEQDNITNNGKESIKWKIVKKDNSKALLYSNDVLDCMAYEDTNETTTWNSCSLRKWLNNDFYQTAFNSYEKEWILENEINNNTEGYCMDKVFIFSEKEYEEYGFLNSWSTYAASIAEKKGANIGSGPIWLRNLVDGNTRAKVSGNYYAEDLGINWASFYIKSRPESIYGIGVKPAIWVNYQ